MPSYHGIHVYLQSQFDLMTIPEYPRPLTTRARSSDSEEDATFGASQRAASSLPEDGNIPFQQESSANSSQIFSDSEEADNETATVLDIYIPFYRSSQFWISYSIDPVSVLTTSTTSELSGGEVKFIYFKLVLNGRDFVSWGVGEEEQWRGKTMWALADGGCDWRGRGVVRKEGLFFGDDDGEEAEISDGMAKMLGDFEVRVYRARGRKKRERVVEKSVENDGAWAVE